MKSKIIPLTIALIMLVAYLTNPDKRHFLQYFAEEQIEKADEILGKRFIAELKKWSNEAAEEIAESDLDFVRVNDYYLFSVYTFEIPVIGKEYRYLGAFHHFIPLSTQ